MARRRTKKGYVRAAVRLRADGHCELCGRGVDRALAQADPAFPTLHHRWPHRQGGIDHVSNLLLICHACHSGVHKDEYMAHAFGWMTSQDEYKCTPVLCAKGWVRLLEDGTYEALNWWEAEVLTRERGNAKKQSAA